MGRHTLWEYSEYGADVNAQSLEGRTALIEAAHSISSERVGILLEAVADINIQSYDGTTALLEAVMNMGSFSQSVEDVYKIVSMLIALGADVNLQRYDENFTTLLCAAEKAYALIELLIEAGADITVQDFNGKYPADFDEGGNTSSRDSGHS